MAKTAAGPAAEAKTIMETYFLPLNSYFNSMFPEVCTVASVTAFNALSTLGIPNLVDPECQKATEYLADLWIGKPDREELAQQTRARVSRLLADEMQTWADTEHDASNKRDDKDCATVETWAKAQLSASITSESFGKWARVG